jgi:hypothetical protein
MAAKLIDRPLTFAVPQVGAQGSLLPQQVALGTVARIRQTAPDYFNVTVQEHGKPNGEIRLYIVRKHVEDGSGTWPKGKASWVVEAPSTRGESGYTILTAFNGTPERLRAALGWAVRYLTADWIIEVREGGQAR